jgi:hypothetical protein
MKDDDLELLSELLDGAITEDLFLEHFSIDIRSNPDFVTTEINDALSAGDQSALYAALSLIPLTNDALRFVNVLNELLINQTHRSHQLVAKTLQDMAPSPSTVPYVRRALESNFDYLAYTCSENAAIAKWFSWLLYAIGTEDANKLMREFSNSSDEGIAKEMQYRLRKMGVE